MKGMMMFAARHSRGRYHYRGSNGGAGFGTSFTPSSFLQNSHFRPFSSGADNGDNSGDGGGHATIKGSMNNFLRQAKNKTASDETKPWSKLLNDSEATAPNSFSSSSSFSQHSDRNNHDEKKRNKPLLDQEIISSLYEDDQYDSDYTPSDAELMREANDAYVDQFNPNKGRDTTNAFEELVEEEEDMKGEDEFQELLDAFIDPTPERVKNILEKKFTNDPSDENIAGATSEGEDDSKYDKASQALKKFNKGVQFLEQKHRQRRGRGRRRDDSEGEEEEVDDLDEIYEELKGEDKDKVPRNEDGTVCDDPPDYHFEDEV
jgi:hypothetical protein